MVSERLEVQRTVAARPAAIFRLLCDPQGHVAIDSSGMLMQATGESVAAVGDSFVVHMDREALNDYPMGLYDVIDRSGLEGSGHLPGPVRGGTAGHPRDPHPDGDTRRPRRVGVIRSVSARDGVLGQDWSVTWSAG
jgi:hypothetical protein